MRFVNVTTGLRGRADAKYCPESQKIKKVKSKRGKEGFGRAVSCPRALRRGDPAPAGRAPYRRGESTPRSRGDWVGSPPRVGEEFQAAEGTQMVTRFAPRVVSPRLGRSMWADAAPLRPDPHPPPFLSVPPLQDLNARLKRLVQSGRLPDAQALFDGAPHRDEASYSALLAGHAAAGDVSGAMALFSRLRASSLPAADPFVLSLAFKACAAAADASHAASLHAFAVRSSAVSSVFVATALADAYAKAGCLALALRVFDEMPLKNVVSWTTLVSALARAGRRHDAVRRFAEMRASGMPCDSHAFAAALTACADTGLLSRGREVHALCAKLGFDATPYVANTLATLYARCGDVHRALAAVSRMGSRDVAAWTTVISSYAQTGCAKEAILAFVAMLRDGASNAARPNEYTYAAVIAACANISCVYLGEQLHAQAAQRGFASARSVANSLVTLYARAAGRLSAADAVFRESAAKDVVSWSAIISGYAQEGLAGEAFALFTEMRRTIFLAPMSLLLPVSSVCVQLLRHWTLVASSMHLLSLLDLNTMPWSGVHSLTWHVQPGEEQTGKKAAERAMEAEPWGAGAHVAMANLYASKGQWSEAAQERHMMKQKGVVKGVGWSSVTVGGEERGVGVFVAGDRTHPQDNVIYEMLDLIYYGVGMARYVPDQMNLASEVELMVDTYSSS
ncbi:hypothetical protein ZWY2020_015143 [Hordeum vulgare]|nr:hypothetical protein ZWY2020_015143 [Hordeum vulgare]